MGTSLFPKPSGPSSALVHSLSFGFLLSPLNTPEASQLCGIGMDMSMCRFHEPRCALQLPTKVMAHTPWPKYMQARPPEHLRPGKPQWFSAGPPAHLPPSPPVRMSLQTRAWLPDRPSRHSSQSSSPVGHHSANGRPQVGIWAAHVRFVSSREPMLHPSTSLLLFG